MTLAKATTSVILLGVTLFFCAGALGTWLASRTAAEASDAERLEELNGLIGRMYKKLLDAKLRGINAHPPPKIYTDWNTERDRVRQRIEYATRRSERYADRLRYAGLAVMALGVVGYLLLRLRLRSAR